MFKTGESTSVFDEIYAKIGDIEKDRKGDLARNDQGMKQMSGDLQTLQFKVDNIDTVVTQHTENLRTLRENIGDIV